MAFPAERHFHLDTHVALPDEPRIGGIISLLVQYVTWINIHSA